MIKDILQNGFIEHKVKGSSMMPFIRNGETVYIVNDNNLKKRDVGLFINNEKFFLHRVKKVKKDGYVFCGDNLKTPDGFIPKENVFGKLTIIYKSKNGKKTRVTSKSYRIKVWLYVAFKPICMFFMRLISKIKK